MSAPNEAVLRDIAAALPVTPNARKRQIWLACFVVGSIAFGYLLLTNPLRAWGAWAINTIYWLGIAEGGVVLAAAIRLTNGRWGGPMHAHRRVALGVPAIRHRDHGRAAGVGIWKYLPWTTGVDPRQAPFLNVPFL